MNSNPCEIRTPLNNTTKVLVFFETAKFFIINYAIYNIYHPRFLLFTQQNKL